MGRQQLRQVAEWSVLCAKELADPGRSRERYHLRAAIAALLQRVLLGEVVMKALSILWIVSLLGIAQPSFANGDRGILLDVKHAHCESSALLAQPCPNGKADCLWLGDNEVENEIFLLSEFANTAPLVKAFGLKNAKSEVLAIGDIEALAALPGGKLLVVGSHAHKSDCKVVDKRIRFGLFDVATSTTTQLKWRHQEKDHAWRCANTLASISSPRAAQFCALVEAAATKAAQIYKTPGLSETDKKANCATVGTLNIEGASADPANRVWLGMRAPLLMRRDNSAAAPQDAVLLRIQIPEATGVPFLGFDALRTLDLQNRGIRELTASKYWLWIIAGSAQDSTEPFVLYRLAWAELESGVELLHPTRIRELENSTEGFALIGDAAYTAVDGDKGACAEFRQMRSLVWPAD